MALLDDDIWDSLDLRQPLVQLPPRPWLRPSRKRNDLWAFDRGTQLNLSTEGGGTPAATTDIVAGLGILRPGAAAHLLQNPDYLPFNPATGIAYAFEFDPATYNIGLCSNDAGTERLNMGLAGGSLRLYSTTVVFGVTVLATLPAGRAVYVVVVTPATVRCYRNGALLCDADHHVTPLGTRRTLYMAAASSVWPGEIIQRL